MQKPILNLDREFIDWFYNQPYPDEGSCRWKVYGYGNPLNKENADYWMRESFKAGARAMWLDINQTLALYACAVEGCDPELLEPCEVYDRARESLHHYVTQMELFDVS
jgi:hypothetical protein